MPDDRRLIEDYLPIVEISKEASREKSVRKGHISTLHLWWARRPLVACRAAVYGALVPADRWVKDVNLKNPPADAAKAEMMANGAKRGLNRRAAAEFVTQLCQYPKDSDPGQKAAVARAIDEARRHILEAHRDRLVAESQENVAAGKPPVMDKAGQAITKDTPLDQVPPPKVLDMFAGGGAIPLEALRLGCEAYALDLNPVAHIIELCTLVYPQKYGKADPSARGMTGPKNKKGETTWGGLAEEVRYWGDWVREKVEAETGDLYPPIPAPVTHSVEIGSDSQQRMDFAKDRQGRLAAPSGYMTPVAYLWTRTVNCKNPSCSGVVPLVKQTWLCKRAGRHVAAKTAVRKDRKRVSFEVVETTPPDQIDFDPSAGSKGGNAVCPFCGSVCDVDFIKEQGSAGRIDIQLMAVVCSRASARGKVYVPAAAIDESELQQRIQRKYLELCGEPGFVPDESLPPYGVLGFRVQPYGIVQWRDFFTPRQLVVAVAMVRAIRLAHEQIASDSGRRVAVSSFLSLLLGKLVDRMNNVGRWYVEGEKVESPLSSGRLPMVFDFPEINPFGGASGSFDKVLSYVVDCASTLGELNRPATVNRGSATSLPIADHSLDAVITDPPYYDNVPYADLSDFFYVWHRRAVAPIHPEHLAGELSPKRMEAVAEPVRYGRDKAKARAAYEDAMQAAFTEAGRVLKPGAPLVCVYAHKTTVGWATLVDSLRRADFVINEAWPLDTEAPGRERAQDSAALGSSIFLLARKRDSTAAIGNYEDDVRSELEQIVRERVETLWEMGIAGADLVISAVGAGLRAFTKYARVEFANGEEVPAKRFLTEVEGVVLDTILRRLSAEVTGHGRDAHATRKMTLAGVDEPTRFYVLWRYAYRAATLDAGEAIIFANGTHVELDGPKGLSAGTHAVVEKLKGKYRLRDFTERGKDEHVGQRSEDGHPAPLIDTLHRVLWLMENRPRELKGFLEETRPERERLRLVAQALAGTALKGSGSGGGWGVSPDSGTKVAIVGTTPAESAALNKLTANWRSLIEQPMAAGEGGLFGRRAGET